MIGQTISHYKILDKLGEGGMGVVYKARDTKLDRTVALKFLPSHLIASQNEKKRFTLEAKSAAALNHPNICTIHGVDEHKGRQYIVMELVEGTTLRDKIKDGTVDTVSAIHYGQQIAEALEVAHSKNIVHRDIKSANIMVTRDGRVKVMDFGLAKINGSPQVTKTGKTVGTVTYMSPEQLRGDAADERSDIWSFGVVLYEMLTGRLPFCDTYEHAVMYSILNKEPDSVSGINPSVSSELESVVNRCMAKEPGERYQSATGLLEDLNKLDSHPGQRKKSQPVAYSVNKRRSAVVLSLIAIVSVLIIALMMHDGTTEQEMTDAPLATEAIKLTLIPFKNIGDDPSRQVFCDGLSETITSNLTQIEKFHQDLWVVPADEVRELGITSTSEVHKTLGVNYAVTGSLQPLGDQLRLTIHLVDAKNNRQINSRVIDENASNIPALHDRSVESVLSMLNVEFEPETREMIQAAKTSVSPAFEEYIEGIGYLQRFDRSDNIDKAIESFGNAIDLDPGFAVAYAGLGQAYWRKYDYTREFDWLELASEKVQSALNINDNLKQVKITRGMIEAEFGRYGEAIDIFNDVLAADPTNAEAYMELARSYESSGDIEKAESTMKRSIQLKPDYWSGHNRLGAIYLRNNKFSEAIEKFEKVIELTPDNYIGYMNLGSAYLRMGRFNEAQSMLEKSLDFQVTFDASSNLATLYFVEGRYEEAARLFETALEIVDGNYALWGNLASAYYWAPGEREKAESTYRKAIVMAEEQKEINPNDYFTIIDLAGYHAKVGNEEEAIENIKKALDLAPENSWVMFVAGTTFEHLGEREQALHWIEEAIEHGHSKSEIMSTPELEDLLEDERFQELIAN